MDDFDYDRFVDRVEELRSLQKEFFRARQYDVLKKCKEAEKEVDAMIGEYRNRDKPKQASLM